MLKIREQEILDYIERYINEYGFSPIDCEIGEGYITKTVE